MMPKLALSILAAGSIALAGIIALELKSGGSERTSSPAPARAAAAVDPAPKLPEGAHAMTYLNDILARPLFTISRRPAPRSDGASGAKAATPLKSRLAGIVVGPDGKEALFVESGKTKASSIREGEDIEGWTIEKIELERVTVRAGTVSATVEPAGAKR